MKIQICRYFTYTSIALALICMFAGCKKSTISSKNNNNTPAEFFLTAKVDGKDWSANLKDGNYNVSGGTSGELLILLGVQVQGKDSTAIVLAFPKNPSINITKSFDPLQHSVAGYITIAGSYIADPAVNGSGAYSVTSLNDSSKIVEGNFNFIARRQNGTGNNSVNVTDGKFKAVYRTNYSPTLPANLKR